MSTPRAVLWDLDGTLADSREYHWRSWRDTIAPFGITLTDAQFSASFGQRNDAIIPAWLGDRATPTLIRDIGDAKEALYREMLAAGGIAPLPGAADWVRQLHADGWRQAIASSAPRANVTLMARLLGFTDAMGALIGAEDVQHGKPAPDVFLAAAAALGVSPDRAVVVEDAAAGIEAARRAGMPCIGVGDNGTDAALVRAHALDQLPADTFARLIPR